MPIGWLDTMLTSANYGQNYDLRIIRNEYVCESFLYDYMILYGLQFLPCKKNMRTII